MYIFNTLTTLLYIRFPGKDVIACLTAFAGLHGITKAIVCRLAVSSLESVCPPLDSRGKHSRHSLVPNIIFTLRISRNAQPRVATPSACNTCYTPWRMKTGGGEGARVFFAATESPSEAFDSSWSSGKPVVKVCHFNTQVTCDFLTHLVFRTSV